MFKKTPAMLSILAKGAKLKLLPQLPFQGCPAGANKSSSSSTSALLFFCLYREMTLSKKSVPFRLAMIILMIEEGTKAQFIDTLNSTVKQLKQDYIQFLKCLKIQNKKDRIEEEKVLKRLRKQKQENRVQLSENVQETMYSFNEELSKENRLEISFIRILKGLNKLSQFNARMKEYVLINSDSEVIAAPVTPIIEALVQMINRK